MLPVLVSFVLSVKKIADWGSGLLAAMDFPYRNGSEEAKD